MTEPNPISIYRHVFTVPDSATDQNGHVNNVVYVQWMQDVAILHFGASGGAKAMHGAGATWVARSHRIEYLKPAFAGEGVTALFIYYSIGIDWTHPYFISTHLYDPARAHYKEKPAHFRYEKPEDFEKFREFSKAQLKELCTQYGPIAGFWFDTLGGVLANPDMFRMQEFYDLIHEHQPHALILFKTGATGTEDVLVGERSLHSIAKYYQGKGELGDMIADRASQAWNDNHLKKAEICVASQGGWAWSPQKKCQSAGKLYKMLVQSADNNANLLINFSPKPDGSIPEDFDREFRLLGKMIREQGYPRNGPTDL